MSTEVQADWDNREFVEMIERSCRQSVGFLNRFYQSAKYRLAVLDQRLTRVERKLDYIEASLENADVTQRGGNPVPFSGSLFEPESRVDEVRRKLDRRKEARGVFTQEVIHPRKTIKKVLTIESRGGRFTTTQATEQKERDEVPRRQQQPPTPGGTAGAPPSASRPPATNPGAVPPGQPGPPASQPPPQARAAAAQPTRPTQQPGAGRRGQAAPSQPGAQPGAAPGRRGGPPPTVPSAEGPGAGGPPPSVPGAGGPPPAVPKPAEPESKPFPHGDPSRIDMQTVQPGTGAIPKKSSFLEVAYTGWLMDGSQFIEHRETVQLGVGQNIVGLERALLRMTCGQRCKLWIPSGLAYGPAGAGDLIPPNSDLTFDIKLIRIVDQ